MLPFFDVIGLGIVFKAARQQTENADALAGGTDFDVGRTEAVYDGLRPREQLAILDTVVQVDTHDPAADTDADAVIACCGYRSLKGCECGRVIHIGFASCAGHIRHLGLIAVPQFISPVAELAVVL